MNILHQEKVGLLTIKLVQDDHCECDPRGWDNLGTMACFHRRYTLGDDVTNIKKQGQYYFPDHHEFRKFAEETKPIMLPLYLYDHSGLAMSTGSFSCPWDSGQVGWIFCPLEKACGEYSVKKVTPTIRRKVLAVLRSEVEVYTAHLEGNCWGVTICNEDGDALDACWGYHGYKCIDWDYALSEARAHAQVINKELAIAPAI